MTDPTAPAPTPDPAPTDPPAFQPPASQDELNRIIGERLARERAKFADYEELKALKAERDKELEAQKSEHEKAVEAARREGETSALERANKRLKDAEARALAAAAKFRNPALAVKAISLDDVPVADDGTVDAEAIKTRLESLAEAEPYLVDDGSKPTPRPDHGQGGGPTKGDAGSLTGLDGNSLYDRLHPKTA